MKRFVGTINKHTSQSARSSSHPADSPEAIVVRELTAFCESGGPNNTGNEYLHLPAIVEAAESSPGAAKEAANHIRRFLSNPSSQKGYKQYNAVMLIRILVDNPGDTFTRNFDAKFVGTVKDLLRDGRDMSVQQILRETMEFLSVQKASDPNLKPLSEMWKKEKQKFEKALGISAGSWMAPQQQQQQPPSQRQDYFARQHRSRGLPAPGELSSRISEANTSAKLLHQLIQSTPTEDFLANDLLREFSDRCQSAARSIVGYINSTNPPPDEDTMLTLIETNDRLAVALSKYQRAALVARKTLSRSQSQDINVASQNQMHADHPQPGPLTTSATAPQPNQIATIKQRTVPILSLPRKALNKLRSDKTSQAPEPAPSAQQEQEPPSPPRTPPQHRIDASSAAAAATLTRSPQSAISPVQSSPPTLRANPPTATLSSSIAGAGAPRSNGTTTTATATSTSAAYQYNSSDFTVENPFADTYSSSHFDKDHDHHDASARATAGAAAASTNADTQPMTSSTYYPGSGFSLFDPNMPGSRPADDSTVPVPASAPVEQSATERFYAGRKVEGAGAV